MKIDLVYLWCSNADPKFLKVMNHARSDLLLPIKKNNPDHRTTDHNELLYSLRSVEKFAPWINRIFIVTYHQVPEWLNLNHPKITIVDHTEIIPPEYLPTFNSAVIEAFLHKIPGLSEHFLFANDDMFLGNTAEPEFFFDKDGKPIHYIRPEQKYTNSYWHKLLKRGKELAEGDTQRSIDLPAAEPSHNIDPYTKTLYADTVNHFWEHYQEMLPNKFRRNNDLQRFLVSCWGYLTDRLIWKEIDPHEVVYIEKVTSAIENGFNVQPPNLFCLNDADILTGTDSFNQQKLLQKLFPEKSEFEKEDYTLFVDQNYGLKPAFTENNIPIIFTIDERFLPFCGVAITSLIQNISSQNNYDIIILNCGGNLSLLNDLMAPQLPANVSLRILDVVPYLKPKRTWMKNFPPEKVVKWAKLFVHEWLNNYDKVLYLDTDILVKCDVAELWQIDLDGKAVGGVVDMAAHHLESPKKDQMDKFYHVDNIDDYINLGVIVMNLDALRQMNLTQKVQDLIAQIPENFWNLYDLFNALLHGDIKLLSMTFNHQYGLLRKAEILYPYFRDEYYLPFQKLVLEGAKIVHFTPVKPWLQIIGKESLNWWNLAQNTDFYQMVLLCEKLSLNVRSLSPQKGNSDEKK